MLVIGSCQSSARIGAVAVAVAVQGVGNVGGYLCHELHQAGAKLTVADVDQGRAQALADSVGGQTVDKDEQGRNGPRGTRMARDLGQVDGMEWEDVDADVEVERTGKDDYDVEEREREGESVRE